MKGIFILLGMLFFINTVFSQNIIKAEYFLDADPGQGNGTVVPGFTAGDIVNFPFTVPTSALSSGFHSLNIRVADANGVWSRYETRGFYLSTATTTNTTNISGAEYFIDSDPGLGNGIPANTGSPGPVVSFVVPVPVSLNSGFHFLAIRVKDQEGKWSMFEQRGFYVVSNPINASPIVAAEYFYDIDPGTGSASPLSITTPGDIITQTFLVFVPVSLSQGIHILAIRVKDQEGHWSMFERDTITVGAVSGSITCPGNITVDPFTNNCKAVVFNIDAVGLSEDDSSYTYTMSGATTGNGIGTASGQLFNAGVTTVTYALINSPTVSCSFTVTVNTSVTPTATISVPSTTVCGGRLTTFFCAATGGGSFTTSFQWKKNGINVGTNSTFYRDSTLQNNDAITVAMTSVISCAVPQTVTSAPVVMTVHETLTPAISAVASATTICPGQSVTFTATPTNGGSQPIYAWVKNGSFVGDGTTVYQTSALANGDSVYVILYNTTDCIIDDPITSNVIHITTSQTVTPSVTISANQGNTICSGTNATFTATPTNGGATPSYQWKVNGNNAGTNSNIYQNSSMTDGDKVTVTMTPSQSCGNNNPVVSNTITMTVGVEVVPSITMSTSATNICAGTLVTFQSSPVSGAGSSPSFQWKRNGINIAGATNSTYQTSSLADGEVIRVEMTSSLSCANPTVVLSHDSVTMGVSSVLLTPSVTILSTDLVICQGQTVTFTAIPTNGGSVPDYQWKVNGNDVGGNYENYSCDSLHNGDIITVEMFTSVPCATTPSITSGPVTMSVTQIKIYYADFDGDGYGNGASGVAEACVAPVGYVASNGDCDDNNEAIHPGATEVCGNGIDDDCDGQTDEACGSPDNDGDGYSVAQGDCNDNNKAVHPGATEVCGNSIDDDCDGQTDEACGSPDNDSDGYTITQGDCNDNNASINPGAAEVCGNGIDDNCNGQADENCTEDLPILIVKTYPAKEGDVGYTTVDIEVRLDRPAISAVRLNYATSNDDAIAGSDYVAANGVLIIPPGSSSVTIQIKVIGDLLRESNERFWLNFTNPVNVVFPDDPRSRIMIIDNDKGKVTTAAANNEQVPIKEEIFKIPTVTRRNQIWVIPQIGNYENEVLIVNVQGQVVSRFANYHNQTAIGNLSTGLYFYRIRIMESPGQYKYYSGRLLITE